MAAGGEARAEAKALGALALPIAAGFLGNQAMSLVDTAMVGRLGARALGAREERGRGVPRYVEDELRRYLRCGLLCHGFVRVRCPACREELVVAFSCKCRASCPSCCARRMCGTAAHLVDHVLPDAPVRQWVVTAPHEVRRLLALHPAALTAMNRIFTSEVARWQKATSRAEGGETGSVTFVQRFDSRLGCFVHLHVLALDGVFTRRGDDAVDFHPGRAPSWAEVREVARRVGVRLTRWLRRRGFIGERAEDEREEQPAPSALEACMRAGGTYARMETDAPEPENEGERRSAKSRWAAEVGGFDVHAGVTVRAGDRDGLERLCRYGARPPFSLERLSLLPSGRVAYRLRKARRDGATHLVLTPMQLLAKLAALVPPPRYPLTRFAGVLAPGSSWRPRVVAHRSATAPSPAEAAKPARPERKRREKGEPAAARGPRGPCTSLGAGVVPCYARVDWASLLRRVYLVDVLSCPCGGRRALLADVTDAATVAAILAHLGLATEPPPVARARDPSADEA